MVVQLPKKKSTLLSIPLRFVVDMKGIVRVAATARFCVGLTFIAVSIRTSTSAASSSNNLGPSSLELFQNSWITYKTVVNADLMEHKSMTQKLSDAIHSWIDDRAVASTSTNSLISIADLGCGDLALLGPVYKSLPLKLFCGVDMSLSALSHARLAFADQPDVSTTSTVWLNDDILSWAKTIEMGSDEETICIQKFDVIVCAFSVHHLDDEDKSKILTALVSNKLNKGGVILMADIFRIENEDRDEYIGRFRSHIEANWNVISPDQKIEVVKHVTENDFPASLQHFMSDIAPSCGLNCDLLWSDTADFEKLLKLTVI